jgi:WD repeat-containing protein 49
VNCFLWCSSNRFIASCGEERHIILWNAYTLKPMTYLTGHTTSIQQLALNEERNHLISLGSDKVVKIWDIRSYRCFQTLTDTNVYRPEDMLTFMVFDPKYHYILVSTRKINIWPVLYFDF